MTRQKGLAGAALLLIAAILGLNSTESTQAAPLGQGTASPTAGTPAGGTVAPALAVGHTEYVQMSCANCHGPLRTPRGVMPPYPTGVLSDPEVAAISAYVNSLPAPGAAITATENVTVTMQKLGMGLEALRYLQTRDMQKYLARGDLQSALQQLQQALGALQQQLSARTTALPALGLPTTGIQATPKGALPLPLLPTPTTAPPGAPAPTSISASVATPGGAAVSTPGPHPRPLSRSAGLSQTLS